MSKLAPHQTPWIRDAAASADFASEVARVVAAHAARVHARRLALVAGGDHGYWREERCVEDEQGEAWLERDSHRGAPSRVAFPRDAALEVLAMAARAEPSRPPGYLVVYWDASTPARVVVSEDAGREILARTQASRAIEAE